MEAGVHVERKTSQDIRRIGPWRLGSNLVQNTKGGCTSCPFRWCPSLWLTTTNFTAVTVVTLLVHLFNDAQIMLQRAANGDNEGAGRHQTHNCTCRGGYRGSKPTPSSPDDNDGSKQDIESKQQSKTT